MEEKFLLLGASRGLGFCFLKILESLKLPVCVVSRKAQSLESHFQKSPQICFKNYDLTQSQDQKSLIDFSLKEQPQRVIYFAGGGPYGVFSEKQWRDHQWALELSLLFPLRFFHALSSQNFLKQFVLIGSSVAEDQGDAKAASYAAAKHGLLGFHRSMRLEKVDVDLRLFSPTYMKTDLLPKNSPPRKQGRAKDPSDVAQHLWTWLNKDAEFGSYLSYK